MSGSRALTIAGAVIASIVAVVTFLLLPASIAVGHPLSAVVEAAVLVMSVWYVARVMRADRRQRLAREAALPPERRPERREPRRPITFQLRETAFTFAIWSVIVFVFDSLALAMDPYVNLGVAAFAGFMLATLTVTGRHMMFRLTAEDDDTSGSEAASRRPPQAGRGEREDENSRTRSGSAATSESFSERSEAASRRPPQAGRGERE